MRVEGISLGKLKCEKVKDSLETPATGEVPCSASGVIPTPIVIQSKKISAHFI
jgi:hypothetical protein